MELPPTRPGQTAAEAARVLESAAIEFDNVDSELSGQPQVSMTGIYDQLVNRAAGPLGNVFPDTTVSALLYDEDYWRIRIHGLAMQTQLGGVISKHAGRCSSRLQELQAGFAAEAERWRHQRQGTLLVADTSVFLEPGLDLPTYDWVAAARGSGFSGNAHVVVPITVVDELDGLKRNNNTKQAARAALKWLADRLPPAGAPPTMLQGERVPITSLQAYVTRAPSHPDDADNEIIQAAEMIRDRSSIMTILLTRDLSMRLRAEQAGLMVRFRETET